MNPRWWLKEQPYSEPPSHVGEIAQKAIDVYLLSTLPNGEIRGIGWWQSANGYTAIALCDIWSDSERNCKLLSWALRECESHRPDFINEYNDDTLWWALCCLHVHAVGGDVWFLDRAKSIWKHIRENAVCRKGQCEFRGQDMEGACYWTSKPERTQLNSITTGLFVELSVRLALIEENSPQPSSPHHAQDLIEHARRALAWILRFRYRQEGAVVLDNILLQEQEVRDWTFTYTTGVTLAVCALLYEATREDDYLSLACRMTARAMRRASWVEGNGVLTERGAYGKGNHQPGENNDAVGFKAVLMRSLATLYDVIGRTECSDPRVLDTAGLIRAFVNVNFQSQQDRNTNGRAQYGPWWNGPFERSTAHSQMAVLDVLAAALLVNRKELADLATDRVQ